MFQFSLRRMLSVIFVACIMSAVVVYWLNEENWFERSFANTPGVGDVVLIGDYEVPWLPKCITHASFSLKEWPGSNIELYIPDPDIFHRSDHFCIARIDNLELIAEFDDGKRFTYPDFGPFGEAWREIGQPVCSVNDLVCRFEGIRKSIKSWPVFPSKLERLTGDGHKVCYYAVQHPSTKPLGTPPTPPMQ